MMVETPFPNIIENLQIIGLLYDVVGIGVLGIPALRRMTTEIAAQAGTYWNYNSELAKGLSEARVDTVAGSCLLIIGFLIQAAGISGIQAPWICGALLIGLLALFIVLWLAFGRRSVAHMLLQRVERRLERTKHEKG